MRRAARRSAKPAAALGLVLLVGACGSGESRSGETRSGESRSGEARPEGGRRVVLVSGRDDHGLVASRQVLLRSRPDGGSVVGRLADGTLAEVHAVQGTQVQVSADGVTGWVDDFSLRGELRLAGPPPGCRVRVGGVDLPAGTRVEVLSLDGATATVRLLDPTPGVGPRSVGQGVAGQRVVGQRVVGQRAVGTVAVSDLGELAPSPGRPCPAGASGRTDDPR